MRGKVALRNAPGRSQEVERDQQVRMRCVVEAIVRCRGEGLPACWMDLVTALVGSGKDFLTVTGDVVT